MAWSKHTWKRGDRRQIVTNIAKSEREGLDPHRQFRLNHGTPLQERRAYACNTAGPALAVEATNVLTSTPMAVPQREATPRVHKPLKARTKKAREKAEVKAEVLAETVAEVKRALTLLPI